MNHLDLDAIREKWLRLCGPCDLAYDATGCTHPDEDYRPVILSLVEEIDRLRAVALPDGTTSHEEWGVSLSPDPERGTEGHVAQSGFDRPTAERLARQTDQHSRDRGHAPRTKIMVRTVWTGPWTPEPPVRVDPPDDLDDDPRLWTTP